MKSKLKYSATLWQQLNYDPIIMDYIGGHSEAFCYQFSAMEIHITVLQQSPRSRTIITEELNRMQNCLMLHLIGSDRPSSLHVTHCTQSGSQGTQKVDCWMLSQRANESMIKAGK